MNIILQGLHQSASDCMYPKERHEVLDITNEYLYTFSLGSVGFGSSTTLYLCMMSLLQRKNAICLGYFLKYSHKYQICGMLLGTCKKKLYLA